MPKQSAAKSLPVAKDTFAAHLEFALKHEQLNLGGLKLIFNACDPSELVDYIKSRPRGVYTRKAWFFYEFLTGDKLDIPDNPKMNYISALDENEYIASQGHKEPRYKVINNLLGNVNFCPVVRKSDFDISPWQDKKERLLDIIRDCDDELLERAIHYLFSHETKSTYSLENEQVDLNKSERFVQALGLVGKDWQISKDNLVDLQTVILDKEAAASDYRDTQNYVGQSVGYREVYHHISTKPEDVSRLMDGIIKFVEDSKDLDPIMVAALASFGFVFVHPFDDGNGRTHRFMIHQILAEAGFNPEQIIVPISATLLKNQREYNQALEQYSSSVLPFIEKHIHDDQSITVTNETAHLYQYFDGTHLNEYMHATIDAAISIELKNEIKTIRIISAADTAINNSFDIPVQKRNLILKFALQNEGTLSNKRKQQLAQTIDIDTLNEIELLIKPIFTGEEEAYTPSDDFEM